MARLPVVVGVLAAAAVLRCAAQETTGYFLNDCPKATGADYALCALSESEKIWISDGPCQGAATKGNDDVFSSCYCKMQVQMGGCYATVCPDNVMSRYTSSISKVDCPSSVWPKITAEAQLPGGGGGGGGQQGSSKNAGPEDLVVPIAGGVVACLVGVAAVLL